MKTFKYIGLMLRFKDVKKIYAEENLDKSKPALLSRRFLGAVIALGGAAMTAIYGITIEPEKLTSLVDTIENLGKALPVVYGAVLSLKGFYDTYVKTLKETPKLEVVNEEPDAKNQV